MGIELDWDIGSDDPSSKGHRIGMRISEWALAFTSRFHPDLSDLFPFGRQFFVEVEASPKGWIAARVHWVAGMQMPVVGGFKESGDRVRLHEAMLAEPPLFFWRPTADFLGSDWFGIDRFTYIGPTAGQMISRDHLAKEVLDWLQTMVVPAAENLNKRRVLRAIPEPPNFDIGKISAALWVLECEVDVRQGTAFLLQDVGLVTCSHVLGRATKAFRYDDVPAQFDVTVLKRNEALDLAILAAPPSAACFLSKGRAGDLRQMDHILLAGHPNYRRGDSPVTTPGLVVGTRPVSGVRRLLTNAPIIAGMSGCPAIDRTGQVIGVAVTGADSFEESPNTENHGILPIEALDSM